MYKYLANTVFTGKNIVYLPTCHSTNDIARDFIRKNESCDGTIVITDNQIAGKGQRGNQWLSTPGENITASFIYKPHFLTSEDAFWLNIITSLAIFHTLKDYGIDSLIKWPNDIYVGNKKISGILIENVLVNKKINFSIIGIGLNVNQEEFSLDSATSMYRITNRNYLIENILKSIATHLEQKYLEIKSGGYAAMKSDYLKNLMGKDQVRKFEVGGREVKGIIEGVDSDGRLKIEIAGKTEYYSFKEIKFLT